MNALVDKGHKQEVPCMHTAIHTPYHCHIVQQPSLYISSSGISSSDTVKFTATECGHGVCITVCMHGTSCLSASAFIEPSLHQLDFNL